MSTVTRRHGISVPIGGVPLSEHREWYEELAALGYTDIWSSETNAHDAFTPLALAAAWAPSLRLGTAIVPVFTRGAASLAQTAASLCDAAPGRFVLGIGASSPAVVHDWNGIAYEKPYARVRDTLRFLRAALTGEKVTAEYETFTVRGLRLETPPREPPPILVAALRPSMLRLAGAEGDGAILNWLSADDVARVVPYVGDDKEVMARLFVVPTDDFAAVRASGVRMIAAYLNVPAYRRFHEWLGRGAQLQPMWDAWEAGDRQRATEVVSDELIDELFIWGSPDEIRAHIERYCTNGVTTPAPMIIASPADARALIRKLAPNAR